AFDEQQAPPPPKRPPRPQPAPVPIAPPTQEQTIIGKKDMPGGEFLSGGHDRMDSILMEDGMVDETGQYYLGYQEDLSTGKKLKIKTPEERKAAFEETMKKNEELFVEASKVLIERNKKMLEEVAEAKKKRKASKRRRRR
ncbi:MAG: hypothetical protein NWE76_05660, partial [Candidatus Bathyarchaeota archaeon]|nr:hypothetical protein [Candidatus Bathyarchaeota archaeon]